MSTASPPPLTPRSRAAIRRSRFLSNRGPATPEHQFRAERIRVARFTCTAETALCVGSHEHGTPVSQEHSPPWVPPSRDACSACLSPPVCVQFGFERAIVVEPVEPVDGVCAVQGAVGNGLPFSTAPAGSTGLPVIGWTKRARCESGGATSRPTSRASILTHPGRSFFEHEGSGGDDHGFRAPREVREGLSRAR